MGLSEVSNRCQRLRSGYLPQQAAFGHPLWGHVLQLLTQHRLQDLDKPQAHYTSQEVGCCWRREMRREAPGQYLVMLPSPRGRILWGLCVQIAVMVWQWLNQSWAGFAVGCAVLVWTTQVLAWSLDGIVQSSFQQPFLQLDKIIPQVSSGKGWGPPLLEFFGILW